MQPEQTRQERFSAYANYLRERFRSGLLSQVQPLNQWVVWRGELIEGKRKKVPYNPNYRNAKASVKIPKSWGSFETALTALESGNYSGLGLMITPPLVFIDLDHCVAKETGEIIDPKAQDIVKAINSYTEISPSRTGLHILSYGSVPASLHNEIEVYGQERFTTITTRHVPGTPQTVEHRQSEVTALFKEFAPVVTKHKGSEHGGGVVAAHLTELPPEAANDKLLQALLSGDMSSVGNDQSRADWILLMKLLHWTGDNKSLTKEIFFQSPLGQREKARDTEGKGRRGNTNYVDKTIDKILERRHNPAMKR